MTPKPCSEIAKEIVYSSNREIPCNSEHFKGLTKTLINGFTQELQTERTARENAEAQLKAQAEVIGKTREALKPFAAAYSTEEPVGRFTIWCDSEWFRKAKESLASLEGDKLQGGRE